MKDHLFIDTDVLVDVVSLRYEFLINSAKILNLLDKGEAIGYTSTVCIVNCNYLMEKAKILDRIEKIRLLTSLLTILPCTSIDISVALASKFVDFEDSVQNAIAENSKKCKFIITRNTKDYSASNLEILTPDQYLKKRKKFLA